MAISIYEKDGKTYWQVYVDIRSRIDRTIRVQRRVNNLETERAALAEEKKLVREQPPLYRRSENLPKELRAKEARYSHSR